MICNKILGKVTTFREKRTETLGVANRFMVGGTMCPLGFIGLKKRPSLVTVATKETRINGLPIKSITKGFFLHNASLIGRRHQAEFEYSMTVFQEMGIYNQNYSTKFKG